MQSVSSRIRTRVGVSISCNSNHYNRDAFGIEYPRKAEWPLKKDRYYIYSADVQ